jgi:hypothetical protein
MWFGAGGEGAKGTTKFVARIFVGLRATPTQWFPRLLLQQKDFVCNIYGIDYKGMRASGAAKVQLQLWRHADF